ncbi:hypothetical protein CLOM_g21637 [Closterium sp. NIES-68]|nr:hypothetical protein CLOM_g21637 [Closterium sp. NIES-68]
MEPDDPVLVVLIASCMTLSQFAVHLQEDATPGGAYINNFNILVRSATLIHAFLESCKGHRGWGDSADEAKRAFQELEDVLRRCTRVMQRCLSARSRLLQLVSGSPMSTTDFSTVHDGLAACLSSVPSRNLPADVKEQLASIQEHLQTACFTELLSPQVNRQFEILVHSDASAASREDSPACPDRSSSSGSRSSSSGSRSSSSSNSGSKSSTTSSISSIISSSENCSNTSSSSRSSNGDRKSSRSKGHGGRGSSDSGGCSSGSSTIASSSSSSSSSGGGGGGGGSSSSVMFRSCSTSSSRRQIVQKVKADEVRECEKEKGEEEDDKSTMDSKDEDSKEAEKEEGEEDDGAQTTGSQHAISPREEADEEGGSIGDVALAAVLGFVEDKYWVEGNVLGTTGNREQGGKGEGGDTEGKVGGEKEDGRIEKREEGGAEKTEGKGQQEKEGAAECAAGRLAILLGLDSVTSFEEEREALALETRRAEEAGDEQRACMVEQLSILLRAMQQQVGQLRGGDVESAGAQAGAAGDAGERGPGGDGSVKRGGRGDSRFPREQGGRAGAGGGKEGAAGAGGAAGGAAARAFITPEYLAAVKGRRRDGRELVSPKHVSPREHKSPRNKIAPRDQLRSPRDLKMHRENKSPRDVTAPLTAPLTAPHTASLTAHPAEPRPPQRFVPPPALHISTSFDHLPSLDALDPLAPACLPSPPISPWTVPPSPWDPTAMVHASLFSPVGVTSSGVGAEGGGRGPCGCCQFWGWGRGGGLGGSVPPSPWDPTALVNASLFSPVGINSSMGFEVSGRGRMSSPGGIISPAAMASPHSSIFHSTAAAAVAAVSAASPASALAASYDLMFPDLHNGFMVDATAGDAAAASSSVSLLNPLSFQSSPSPLLADPLTATSPSVPVPGYHTVSRRRTKDRHDLQQQQQHKHQHQNQHQQLHTASQSLYPFPASHLPLSMDALLSPSTAVSSLATSAPSLLSPSSQAAVLLSPRDISKLGGSGLSPAELAQMSYQGRDCWREGAAGAGGAGEGATGAGGTGTCAGGGSRRSKNKPFGEEEEKGRRNSTGAGQRSTEERGRQRTEETSPRPPPDAAKFLPPMRRVRGAVEQEKGGNPSFQRWALTGSDESPEENRDLGGEMRDVGMSEDLGGVDGIREARMKRLMKHAREAVEGSGWEAGSESSGFHGVGGRESSRVNGIGGWEDGRRHGVAGRERRGGRSPRSPVAAHRLGGGGKGGKDGRGTGGSIGSSVEGTFSASSGSVGSGIDARIGSSIGSTFGSSGGYEGEDLSEQLELISAHLEQVYLQGQGREAEGEMAWREGSRGWQAGVKKSQQREKQRQQEKRGGLEERLREEIALAEGGENGNETSFDGFPVIGPSLSELPHPRSHPFPRSHSRSHSHTQSHPHPHPHFHSHSLSHPHVSTDWLDPTQQTSSRGGSTQRIPDIDRKTSNSPRDQRTLRIDTTFESAHQTSSRDDGSQRIPGIDRKESSPRDHTIHRRRTTPRDGSSPLGPTISRDPDSCREHISPRDHRSPRDLISPRDHISPRGHKSPREQTSHKVKCSPKERTSRKELPSPRESSSKREQPGPTEHTSKREHPSPRHLGSLTASLVAETQHRIGSQHTEIPSLDAPVPSGSSLDAPSPDVPAPDVVSIDPRAPAQVVQRLLCGTRAEQGKAAGVIGWFCAASAANRAAFREAGAVEALLPLAAGGGGSGAAGGGLDGECGSTNAANAALGALLSLSSDAECKERLLQHLALLVQVLRRSSFSPAAQARASSIVSNVASLSPHACSLLVQAGALKYLLRQLGKGERERGAGEKTGRAGEEKTRGETGGESRGSRGTSGVGAVESMARQAAAEAVAGLSLSDACCSYLVSHGSIPILAHTLHSAIHTVPTMDWTAAHAVCATLARLAGLSQENLLSQAKEATQARESLGEAIPAFLDVLTAYPLHASSSGPAADLTLSPGSSRSSGVRKEGGRSEEAVREALKALLAMAGCGAEHRRSMRSHGAVCALREVVRFGPKDVQGQAMDLLQSLFI